MRNREARGKADAAWNETERARCAVQRQFDASRPRSTRSRLGQFATPPSLAGALADLAMGALSHLPTISFLDPAGGTGAFYSALLARAGRRLGRAVAFEIDTAIADAARKLWSQYGLVVVPGDFTLAHAPEDEAAKADLVICNPPYVRHHAIPEAAKRRLRSSVAAATGIGLSGLAGLYCHFLLLAHAWLRDDGVGVWLLPSEFMDVAYGEAVRRYLTTEVTLRRLHRFDPADTQFSDALVTSAVVLFQKRAPAGSERVVFSSAGTLERPARRREVSVQRLGQLRKWSEPAFGARAGSRTLLLGDLFEVRRGVATGANRFFVLGEERARLLGLPGEFLTPVLPSPRHVKSCVIGADGAGWPEVEPRLVLLNCALDRQTVRERYPELHGYLVTGEAAGLPERYLLRRRRPWYRQEVRPPAPILCTYITRAGPRWQPFRFLRNHSIATAPNVYLMLYPRGDLRAAADRRRDLLDELFEILAATPDCHLAGHGRSYGGGLRKLEPGELCEVPLPSCHVISSLASAARGGQLTLGGA
jgi:adenine-specific DNA-methyltransferase